MKTLRDYLLHFDEFERNKELQIQEGLITSQSILNAVIAIKKNLPSAYFIQKGPLLIFSVTESEEKINEVLNILGYFIADKGFKDGRTVVTAEPKFPLHYNLKDSDEIFHLAPQSKLDKIKKIGLAPKPTKRKGFTHPGNRIYFLLSANPKADLSVLKMSLEENDKESNKMEDYVIFSVLGKDLFHWDFFVDPQMYNFSPTAKGIFTLKNLPPSILNHVG